jgi:WD40 repeat protein
MTAALGVIFDPASGE